MKAEKAPDEFHARFSARKKTYIYRVVNGPVMSPFWRRFALHEARPLDVGRMNDAARFFLGEHDWTAFASAKSDGEGRVRNVLDFTVESSWNDQAQGVMIEFRISASGFLRYMVRSIVGTMLEVGRGEKDFDTIQTAILTGDRDLAGQTAPAQGLTLFRVDYD
jgi:tRNA pseudouridine38-40 synthase